jgi:hypothetical protein
VSAVVQVPDKMPTAFTAVLRDAVLRAGARRAIFLDNEGEAIDEFSVDEFEQSTRIGLQLIGAHLGIVLLLVRERGASLGEPRELIIEAERAVIIAAPVDDRYLAVIEAGPRASIGLMSRELRRAIEALRAEM